MYMCLGLWMRMDMWYRFAHGTQEMMLDPRDWGYGEL